MAMLVKREVGLLFIGLMSAGGTKCLQRGQTSTKTIEHYKTIFTKGTYVDNILAMED